MGKKIGNVPGLPAGEQPLVERLAAGPVTADTFAGPVHVEWDNSATLTPLGFAHHRLSAETDVAANQIRPMGGRKAIQQLP